MPRTLSILLVAAAGISFVSLLVFVFQDNLSKYLINPRTPFQASPAPPAPDYRTGTPWLLRPDPQGEKGVDRPIIFYVHGTSYDKNKGWNAPVNDPESDVILETIRVPNELGPFASLGDVFAPRYRQATLFTRFTHKFDSRAALELAYSDIARAFEVTLAETNPDRPILLVGYEQGALHVAGLLTLRVADKPDLARRITAAYLIDQALPQTAIEGLGLPKPGLCEDKSTFNCIIAYVPITENSGINVAERRARSFRWTRAGSLASLESPRLACVNPLTWTTQIGYVGPANHKGAASATGLRLTQMPAIIDGAVGAACENGLLLVDRPNNRFLQGKRGFGRQWRAQPFNLFFADLEADARRRLAIHGPILAEAVRKLEPIGETVDLGKAPINRVPN